MGIKYYLRLFRLIFLSIVLMLNPFAKNAFGTMIPSMPPSLSPEIPQPTTWIIHWKKDIDPSFNEDSLVVATYPLTHTEVVRPKREADQSAWLARWQKSAMIDYILPNYQYQAAKAPSDPLQSSQNYLKQIHMEKAWEVETENTDLTIALVDTGVDLSHPDLKDNLINGINLIHPDQPPQDDNGHGTAVAGIIAAAANNDRGIAGILRRARIMPIKALDFDGSGDEARLGEGIAYAIDHGARIVVLSLGLNKYSPYMSSIVQTAEDKGILLVAASGNEGNSVKYPAAYPTVLAVGGVTPDNEPESKSNFGPELDIVAPWNVYTTANNGRYDYQSGTSMAAPQVAAVCALVWKKYPLMKPYQVRNLIRQTAQSLGSPGWNPYTGYGLLRADRALLETPKDNIYENNHQQKDAKSLPISKISYAALNGGGDTDWFYFDAPYDGSIQLQMIADSSQTGIELTHYSNLDQTATTYEKNLVQGVNLKVNKGKSYIKLQLSNRQYKGTVAYQIAPQFHIYRDAFEDNDRQYKAFVLAPHSQSLTGTFDQMNDEDWFMMPIKQSGTLRLKLSTDTARIDPVLLIKKRDEKDIDIDQHGDGITETSPLLNVEPGDYYFKVSNIKDYSYPVNGEYTLDIAYSANYIDPNEPNDQPWEATTMLKGTEYNGIIEDNTDVDWFEFNLDAESLVHFHLGNVPLNRTMKMSLRDKTLKELNILENDFGKNEITTSATLAAGTYYIRLSADQAFQNQMYTLNVTSDLLVGGYIDISGHWAKDAIIRLTELNIIEGYANNRFAPNQPITRGEETAIMAKAFKWTEGSAVHYSDVNEGDWFYDSIAEATQSGFIGGYADGTFRPKNPISRMEMVAMLAHILGQEEKASDEGLPFNDIDTSYWGLPILQQVKARGWITGFNDDSFRPEQWATRAEFTQLLVKILNL